MVSPLIALMHDQAGALHEAGVSAVSLNSTLSAEEAQDLGQRLGAGVNRCSHALIVKVIRTSLGSWGHFNHFE